MAIPSIQVVRDVAAPPETVWDVLTDLDRAPEVLSGIVRVERVAGERYAVGTTWNETRKMFGREGTEQMRVTVVQPPRRTVVEAESGGVSYVTELEVEPAAGGSRLSMTFCATAPQAGLLTRAAMTLMGGLATRATRRVCRQDLEDIAAEAESRV